MNKNLMLYIEICEAMTEKVFLKQINMTEEEMTAFLEESKWKEILDLCKLRDFQLQ